MFHGGKGKGARGPAVSGFDPDETPDHQQKDPCREETMDEGTRSPLEEERMAQASEYRVGSSA